jgi:hypothetical protein
VSDAVLAVPAVRMIEKATPAQQRRTLDLVDVLVNGGILFVPVPVLSMDEYRAQLLDVERRLERLDRLESARVESKR